jgi:hypothetical protein
MILLNRKGTEDLIWTVDGVMDGGEVMASGRRQLGNNARRRHWGSSELRRLTTLVPNFRWRLDQNEAEGMEVSPRVSSASGVIKGGRTTAADFSRASVALGASSKGRLAMGGGRGASLGSSRPR